MRLLCKFFKNKKGTDKPIEIFIALFVILAVAMVILKMFSSQIEQKQKELRDAADRAKLEEARSNLNQFCDARCSEAIDESGIINYCKIFYNMPLDINNNKVYTDYVEDLSIEAQCEDRVYCVQYKPCGSLDISVCKQRMCNYFEQKWELDETKASERLAEYMMPGECYSKLTDEQKKNHWYTLYGFDKQNICAS